MAATIKAFGTSLVLLYLLQSAVVVRADYEYCGGQLCAYGCCGTSGTRCCTGTGFYFSLSGGYIAAIVIGCMVVIGSITACIFRCKRGYWYRPAPVVYSQHAVSPTTVINTAAMSPGTAYPCPPAQQFPMSLQGKNP